MISVGQQFCLNRGQFVRVGWKQTFYRKHKIQVHRLLLKCVCTSDSVELVRSLSGRNTQLEITTCVQGQLATTLIMISVLQMYYCWRNEVLRAVFRNVELQHPDILNFSNLWKRVEQQENQSPINSLSNVVDLNQCVKVGIALGQLDDVRNVAKVAMTQTERIVNPEVMKILGFKEDQIPVDVRKDRPKPLGREQDVWNMGNAEIMIRRDWDIADQQHLAIFIDFLIHRAVQLDIFSKDIPQKISLENMSSWTALCIKKSIKIARCCQSAISQSLLIIISALPIFQTSYSRPKGFGRSFRTSTGIQSSLKPKIFITSGLTILSVYVMATLATFLTSSSCPNAMPTLTHWFKSTTFDNELIGDQFSCCSTRFHKLLKLRISGC
eukprot:TRINITY_DN55744_c0_g1_i1.p2 TRINITY_DN55744_c0_g1~~TRINITY_DN55744_c0_g1_i1.p2  ORF type:complete len:382 (-),score=10.70 TRINITY_DN55744_c0_g1_i1:386-1531(-)